MRKRTRLQKIEDGAVVKGYKLYKFIGRFFLVLIIIALFSLFLIL